MKLKATLSIVAAAAATLASAGDASAKASQPMVFQVSNFSVKAPFKSEMQYRADIVYQPNKNFAARCITLTDTYRQCPNAAGVTPFARRDCEGPGGTNTDGRWFFQLNQAETKKNGEGFNFQFELDAADIPSIAKTLYACKFFPASDVKCNNGVRSPNGPPAAYLKAPSSFTITAQTTAGCMGDYTTGAPTTSTTRPKTTSTQA